MPTESAFRKSQTLYAIGLFLTIALALAAIWVVPYRMWTGPGGSYYTFAYIGDEVMYADKVQPLVPGTMTVNWYNGFGDSKMKSPYYLEDLVRTFLTATGLPVIAFYWMCRIILPAAILFLFYQLACICLPVKHRSWGRLLRVSAAALATMSVFCVYDLVTVFPKWQGFIVRLPTNIEYLVSILLAWGTVRFFQAPELKRGVVVALLSALLVYVRPYAAIPWAYTMLVSMVLALIWGRVSVKLGLAMLGAVVVTLLPWIYVMLANAALPAFVAMKSRFFMQIPSYQVHPQQFLFLGFAVVFAALARFVEHRYRPLAIGSAAAMVLLPYTVGLPSERFELLNYDRFGVFYLVLLATLGLLALGHVAEKWRGKMGQRVALKTGAVLCAVSLVATALVGKTNATLDLKSWGPYAGLVEDSKYLPAYEWIVKNTKPDALFLTAEGFDYSQLPSDPEKHARVERLIWNRQEDLFMVVTRRRRLYCEHLRGEPLTNDELYGLAMLHRGTLGYPADAALYRQQLAKYKPNYIMWRKTPALTLTDVAPPVPRGYGAKLKGISKTVYQDDVAEIWELQWGAGAAKQ